MDALEQVRHSLIGCQWGHVVGTDEDPEPCTEQASRIVVLHHEGEQTQVRLCPKHISMIVEETDPHAD